MGDQKRREPPLGFLDGMKDGGSSVNTPQDAKNRRKFAAEPQNAEAADGDRSPEDDGGQDEDEDEPGFTPGLPGDEDTWQGSILGHPDKWSNSLKSFSHTVASLVHPAAIFWGEDFALLHNQAWADAGGKAEQGTPQRGTLTADAYNALSNALYGGRPKRVDSREFLDGDAKDTKEKYTVLISPLFTDGKRDAAGLFAQFLPRPSINKGVKRRKSDESGSFSHSGLDGRNGKLDISQLGKVVDNVPLDEHPFFHRFAEMLPSGLAILDHRAQAVFVNQHFYQLTSHRGDDKSFMTWPQSIHEDDYDRVMEAYHEAFESQKQLRTEFRAVGAPNPWRLLLLTPLGDENLQHVSLREYGGFICSIVDITSEKSAEISERKAAKEARERREQQERFIDMISHEIRNPLSAVLHCSEDIEEAIADEKNIDIPAIHEAIETINLCISHQRNIVDDVLSYSKLDASMLSLVPKPYQPSKQLANTLKMFQPEFRKQEMEFGFQIDTSYQEFKIDWVMADMARIAQVLVNLISNAIKFTARGNGEKKLQVSVGASKHRPTSYPPNVVFFSSDDIVYKMDNTATSDWGNGEPMYVMVAVKDTGIGISDEGQKKLFERFRQATPKTSDVYGGSGLGLNISRKLCHLHGGEIGVSSKEGSGSTFGFFFMVRLTERPNDYEGRPEEQTIDREGLSNIIRKKGNADPDDADETDVPESLSNPPVETSEDITPHPSGKKDERFQQTSRLTEEMEESRSNEGQPGKSATQQTLIDRTRSSEHRADSGPQGNSGNAQKCHVLLVEDNAINQRIVHRKLTAKGFQVTIANNGREAVEAVQQAPKPSSGDPGAFDIILMDQEMPILDGNSATREIRNLVDKGELENIPILGVTANVRGEQQDDMVRCGMDDVSTSMPLSWSWIRTFS